MRHLETVQETCRYTRRTKDLTSHLRKYYSVFHRKRRANKTGRSTRVSNDHCVLQLFHSDIPRCCRTNDIFAKKLQNCDISSLLARNSDKASYLAYETTILHRKLRICYCYFGCGRRKCIISLTYCSLLPRNFFHKISSLWRDHRSNKRLIRFWPVFFSFFSFFCVPVKRLLRNFLC